MSNKTDYMPPIKDFAAVKLTCKPEDLWASWQPEQGGRKGWVATCKEFRIINSCTIPVNTATGHTTWYELVPRAMYDACQIIDLHTYSIHVYRAEIEQIAPPFPPPVPKEGIAAAALGRKGGKAAAAGMSAQQRSERARKAVAAREAKRAK